MTARLLKKDTAHVSSAAELPKAIDAAFQSAVSAKTVPGITVAVTVAKNVNGDNSADVFALALQTLSYYHQDH